MPPGVLLTTPLPVPPVLTESAYCGAGANDAMTDTCAEPTVKVQVSPVVHPAPLQPENTEAGEDDGNAVRVTLVPVVIGVLVQVPGQLIPPALLVTMPLPVPAKLTVTA